MSKITVGMLRKVAACTSQIAVAASYCANAGAVAALHCANAGALAASYCANAGALAASYCANAGAVAAFTPSTARNRNFANPGELWLPIPSIYAVEDAEKCAYTFNVSVYSTYEGFDRYGAKPWKEAEFSALLGGVCVNSPSDAYLDYQAAELAAEVVDQIEAKRLRDSARPCTTGYTRKVKDPFLQQMVLEETCCTQTDGFIPCQRFVSAP